MKRKLALFLIGILISSYVPHNVLAREYQLNDTLKLGTQKVVAGLSRSPIPVQPKTLFTEPGANTGNSGTITGNNDVEAWVSGGYFEVEIPSEKQVTYPMRITLELNNAEWYFKNDLGIKVIKDGEIKDNIYTPANNEYKLELSRTSSNTATLIVGDKPSNTFGNLLEDNSKENILKNINATLKLINDESASLENNLNIELEDNDVQAEVTNLKNKALEVKNNSSEIKQEESISSIKQKINTLKTKIDNLKNINYDKLKNTLENKDKVLIGKINGSFGNITKSENINNLNTQIGLLDDTEKDPKTTEAKVLKIPLVVRTLTENADSTVRLISSSSLPVDTDKKVFAIGTQSGLTTTIVRKPETSRTNFEIEAIGIKENRINALKPQGAFELVAPSGYEFRMKNARITTEGGISGIDGNFTINHKSTNNNSKDINGKDYSIIQVVYSGLKQSTDITGALAITGLSLIDVNNDTVREQDLYINIRNITGDFLINNKAINVSDNTITPQNVLVGYVRDWKVSLTPIGVVPTLINGRLEGKEKQNINDQDHKAVTVRFEEQVKNAWWSERVTKLTLPRGVKVRKATFERIRNVNEEDLNGVYYNDRSSGTGRIRIDDNVITLSGITSKGEKASFDINLWLNIESGFTGNVDLKVSGSGITDADRNTEDKGVVIAKVVNPIELKAELTDAKIGYQYFTVGNFSITETAAGRLKTNEDVYISIVDNSSDSMQIDPGFKWEVTQGDIRVKNMNTKTQTQLGNLVNNKTNGVHISFTIDKQSTTASQITFRDVQVKLNNNYNTSSKNKFELVVWGPAIANNYVGLLDTKNNNNNINTNDYFVKPGISVPYIESTGVEDNNSFIKNMVKLTVGNPIILVNNKEIAMPTAPYVSQESNSTMVPVRFIATGLGIDESKIIWDGQTGTITIDAGNRIVQMKTNSDIITINGVEIPMLSPDGLRVKVEVKDNRAFIPFRTLGEAFGITVGWDPATATATYNDNKDMLRNYDLNSINTNYNDTINKYNLNKIGDITKNATYLIEEDREI